MASSRVLVYATLVLALLGRSIMAAQPKLVFAHMMQAPVLFALGEQAHDTQRTGSG